MGRLRGAGKVHLVTAGVTVGSGAALVIESGAVVKFMDGTGLAVESGGSCVANGVVFTHVADDTVGGDTMMDGDATAPSAGGYELSGNIVEDDATEERYTAPVQMSGSVSTSVRWRGHRVYRVTGNLTVGSGATLTVAPGTVVKFDPGVSLTVSSGGTLEALGTRAEPIVFTSVRDDAHGGGTNGDGGETVAQPGDWKNLKVAGTARLEHVEVLYGGGESTSSDSGMLTVPSGGTLSLVCCSVAHGLFDGVFSYGTVTGENTAIWDCDRGVNTSGGSGVFKNCVIDRCRWGAMSEGGSGTYYNCIITRFYGSSSWPTGWGLAYWSGALRAYNCCVWSDLSGASNYRSSPSVANMVLADPQFADADAGDFRIAATSSCVDAGDTDAAPDRDAWGQPRMDVKAVADTGTKNADGVCADIGIYEVPGTVTGPMADVAVLSVSVPASARVGEEISVAYVVTNRGTAVASGAVRDAVRLRGAGEGTAGMSVEAVEAVQAYGLEPGQSARMTARVTVPAVAAGAWQVGVEANPARDFFEANLANNRAWSEGTLEVRLDALAAGTHGVTVAAGAVAGYELEGVPESGGYVRVSGAGVAGLEVLAGNGAMPTGEGGGIAAVELPDGGGWLAVLPAREAGEAAYLSLGNGGNAPVAAAVEVSGAATALLAVSPSRVPNAGEAVLTLYGRGLDGVAASAALGGRKAVRAERIDGARALATFDVDGAAAGAVDVSAAGAVLAGAVEIYAVKTGPKLEAWLETPGSIRDGRVFTAHVCYRNAGDAAMPMPLFKVSRLDSTTKLGLAAGEMPSETALYVGGVAPGAPAGVLKAGEEGRVAFFFQPFGSYRLSLAHMEDKEAAGAFPGFGGVAGYREAVAAAATRLALRGEAVADLHALVAQALLERNGQPCAALSGRLVDAAARTPLTGVGIAAIAAADGGAAARTVTDAEGRFVLAELADGQYRFLLDAGTTLAADSTNEVAVAGQADVNGLELHAAAGGRISGHVLDAEGNAVAGGTVVLYPAGGGGVAGAVLADGFGFYEFAGLADGEWSVRALSQGLWCAGLATNLVLGGTVREIEADFELQPGARLSGTVVFGGAAATNGNVQAITADGVSYETGVEADGTWSLDGLPAGSYDVRHYSATALSPDAAVTLAVGDDKTLELVSEERSLFYPTRSVGFGSLETTFLYLDPERAAAASAWEWDFDSDGTVDSREAQPTWTYAAPGTNTVTLVMTEADGTRTTSVYENCVRVEEEIETILKDGAILFGTNSGTLEAVEMGEGRLVLGGRTGVGVARRRDGADGAVRGGVVLPEGAFGCKGKRPVGAGDGAGGLERHLRAGGDERVRAPGSGRQLGRDSRRPRQARQERVAGGGRTARRCRHHARPRLRGRPGIPRRPEILVLGLEGVADARGVAFPRRGGHVHARLRRLRRNSAHTAARRVLVHLRVRNLRQRQRQHPRVPVQDRRGRNRVAPARQGNLGRRGEPLAPAGKHRPHPVGLRRDRRRFAGRGVRLSVRAENQVPRNRVRRTARQALRGVDADRRDGGPRHRGLERRVQARGRNQPRRLGVRLVQGQGRRGGRFRGYLRQPAQADRMRGRFHLQPAIVPLRAGAVRLPELLQGGAFQGGALGLLIAADGVRLGLRGRVGVHGGQSPQHVPGGRVVQGVAEGVRELHHGAVPEEGDGAGGQAGRDSGGRKAGVLGGRQREREEPAVVGSERDARTGGSRGEARGGAGTVDGLHRVLREPRRGGRG